MQSPGKLVQFNAVVLTAVSLFFILTTEHAVAQVAAKGGCDTYSPASGETVTCAPDGSNPDDEGVQTPKDDTSINNVTVVVESGVVLDVNGSTIGLGAGTTVDNSGTLNAGKLRFGYGISAGVNGRSTAGGNTFINQATGVVLTAGSDAHGLYINARQGSATSNTMTNAGAVTTTGSRSDGLRLYTSSSSAQDDITNSGRITTSGITSAGIHIQNAQTQTSITNLGTITVNDASSHGVYIEGAANVFNSGTIQADPSGYAIYVEDNGNTNANAVTLSGNGVQITGTLRFSPTRVQEKLVFDAMGSETTPFVFNNDITGLNVIEVKGPSHVTMGSANGYDLVNAQMTLQSSTALNVTGDIRGSGGLIKRGDGTLRLSGTNTFTGDTTVQGGVLSLESGDAIGAGTLFLNGGGVAVNGGITVTNDIEVNASTRLYSADVGQPESNELSGAITLNGTLSVGRFGQQTQLILSGAIDDLTTGVSSLQLVDLGGRMVFSGGIGQNKALASVSFAGASELASDVTTTGTQSYGAAVTLGADVTLDGAGISSSSTIDGGHGLTITDSSATRLSNVGATTALSSVAITAKSMTLSDVSTTGAQTYKTTGTGALDTIQTNSTYTSAGGAITFDGAVLVNDELVVDTTNSGAASGGANITFKSTLNSEVNEANAVTISAGNVGVIAFEGAVGATTSLGALTVNSGVTLINGGSITTTGSQTYADQLVLGAATTLTVTGLSANAIDMGTVGLTVEEIGTGEVLGIISGASSLTKDGSGTLTLSGVNTYTGGTTVSEGTLKLGVGGAVPGGALVVAADGLFDMNGFDQSLTALSGSGAIALGSKTLTINAANDTGFAGEISGTGHLMKLGSATLTLSGSNTYSGGTTLSAGTLAIDSGSSVGTGAIALAEGTTLKMNKTFNLANAITMSGQATIATGTNAVSASGLVSGSGRLIKLDTGTLILSSNNIYTGGTELQAGTLVAASNEALGSGVLVANSDDVVLRAGKENLTLANAILLTEDLIVDTAGEVMLLNGSVTGGGRLVKRGTGTLTLAGENTFSGGTEVESGTLALDVNAASSSGEVVMAADTKVKADTTLSLNNVFKLRGPVEFDTQGFDLTLNNRLSNNSVGQLIKTGSGTLSLNGNNDYSGGSIVQEGTLALFGSLTSGVTIQSGAQFGGAGTVTGDVTNAGMVRPRLSGSRTTLTILGNYVGQDGTFATTLDGTADAIEADRLVIQGSGNTASGTTSIRVADPSGLLGKPTIGDGILLVDVSGGGTTTTTAFTAPRIAAGAYEYQLVRGGENSIDSWYLRADEEAPEPPVLLTPAVSQREEVALYPALPSLARQYLWSINGTVDDRRGAPDTMGQWANQPMAWGRFIAKYNQTTLGSADKGPGIKADDWGLQLGVDLWRVDTTWGQWRAGPVMTMGRSTGGAYNSSGSVQTGDISLNAYSLGLNATVASDKGGYADIFLLGTRLTGVEASSPLGTSVNTTGWALSGSIEGGWRLPLTEKLAVTPQAQIYTTTVNLRDSQDAYSLVQMPTQTTVLGRMGLKLSYENIQATGPRTQFWARASVYSTLSGKDASTSFLNLQAGNATRFQSQAPGTWAALEGAVNVQASESTQVQIGVGYQSTFDGQYGGVHGQISVRVGF